MVPPYGMRGNKKKTLSHIFEGIPSWYANNVPTTRRVLMYVRNKKKLRFDLHSCKKLDQLKYYMGT